MVNEGVYRLKVWEEDIVHTAVDDNSMQLYNNATFLAKLLKQTVASLKQRSEFRVNAVLLIFLAVIVN